MEKSYEQSAQRLMVVHKQLKAFYHFRQAARCLASQHGITRLNWLTMTPSSELGERGHLCERRTALIGRDWRYLQSRIRRVDAWHGRLSKLVKSGRVAPWRSRRVLIRSVQNGLHLGKYTL